MDKIEGKEIDHTKITAAKQIQRGSFVRIDANLAKKHLFENYKNYFVEDDAAHTASEPFKMQDFLKPKEIDDKIKDDHDVEENHCLELLFCPFPDI